MIQLLTLLGRILFGRLGVWAFGNNVWLTTVWDYNYTWRPATCSLILSALEHAVTHGQGKKIGTIS